jgi:NAD/NADP transhydrogenase alpha subunit
MKHSSGSCWHLATNIVTLPSTSYTITGLLTGNALTSGLAILITDGSQAGSCSTDLNANTYTCIITSTATSVTISAGHSTAGVTVTPSTLAILLDGTAAVTAGTINTQDSAPAGTNYTIVGNITGNQSQFVTVTISESGLCDQSETTNSSYSYACTVTTTANTVTLYATTSKTKTITPDNIVVDLSGSSGGQIAVTETFNIN